MCPKGFHLFGFFPPRTQGYSLSMNEVRTGSEVLYGIIVYPVQYCSEAHVFVTVQFGRLLYKGQRSIYVAFRNSTDKSWRSLSKVMDGIPFSTSNCGSICMKSTVRYKCSLMHSLYVQILPVGCVPETESSGWTSKQHRSSEPSYDAAARLMGLRPIFMVKREVCWQY